MARPSFVEMLWEDLHPAVVLRNWFHLEDVKAVASWVRRLLIDRYGIVMEACERVVASDQNAPGLDRHRSWSSGGGVVHRRRPVRPPGRGLARLTGWLADYGVPASAPLPGRDGCVQVAFGEASASVQRVIDGDPPRR